MSQVKVFRKGKVHVLSQMCATCIFRPGNLMDLQEGRVEQMVRDATRKGSCIPCHETMQKRGNAAVCAGFFTRHATAALQIAQRIGCITYVKPPKKNG